MVTIEESLKRVIISACGERGKEWLEKLPELLELCKKRWHLLEMEAMPDLSYNLVVQATQENGDNVVLKLGVPSGEFANEIRALRHFDGQGFVQMREADPELGVIVMDRVRPGTAMSKVENEDEVIAHFTEALRKVKCAAPQAGTFPDLRQWARGFDQLRDRFDGTTGPFPSELVERAERLYHQLIDTTEEFVLLHGDLHHANLLLAEDDSYIAIDPKGVVGDPCFEPLAFFRNHLLNKEDPEAVLKKRIDVVARTLDLDKKRMIQWGLAHMVVSAYWCINDGYGAWEPSLEIARMFERLLDRMDSGERTGD